MKSLAFLVFLYLAVPGSGQLVWDGLPFSTRAEVAALVLFVVVFFSREIRSTMRTRMAQFHWSGLVKPLLVVLCMAKFLSFAWAPLGGGFASCYRSVYYPLENSAACEKSYEAPFTQGMGAPFANVSRMDRVVDFGESPYDWSLPFINDFPRLGKLWLERIPFSASFAARVNGVAKNQVLPVFGIGELSISINGQAVARKEDYLRDFLAVVPLPVRAANLVVRYEYRDDELAIPPEVAPVPRGPYARLKIGKPLTVEELAGVSRVRVTGDIASPGRVGMAGVVMLDRDGNTVGFNDVNTQLAASGEEPDPLLRPYDVEIEFPAAALLDGPMTLQSFRDGEPTLLATITTPPGTLAPRLEQTRDAATLVTLSASLTADRDALTPLAPGVHDTPTAPLRALLAALDLTTLALLAALAYTLLRTMRTDILHAAALAILGWVAVNPLYSIIPSFAGGGRELVIPYAIIAATTVLAYRHKIHKYPLPFLLGLVTVLSTQKIFEHLHFNHPDQRPRWWGKVFFYWRDSDWFVARGNARAIFTAGSLQANDPVFFSQAASRYLSFASNMLLGEQDVLIGITSLALGFVVILVLASRIANVHERPDGRILAIFTAFISLIFLGDQLIVAFAFFVSSEYPTWIALFGVTAFLLERRNEERSWVTTTIAAMLSILVHFRPNSVFVSIALLTVLLTLKIDLRQGFIRSKQGFWAAAVFLVLLPMSLIHNLFYGASFMPFTGNASINYAFNWTEILRSEGFSGSISMVWSQLRSIMYWREPNDPSYAIFFWGSQIALIASLALRARWLTLKHQISLLALLPLTYLVPMIKFQFTSYFPRFIVAASLLCLCSALLTWPRSRQTA